MTSKSIYLLIGTTCLTGFLVVNTAAWLIYSDGHGIYTVNDGLSVVGYPFVVWEYGGYSPIEKWHWRGLVLDVIILGITVSMSCVIYAWYAGKKRNT
jgi:hypothetical protein